MTEPVAPTPSATLAALRSATPARLGLGRAGCGLPTGAMLDLQLAHARARDAVHAELDMARLRAAFDGEPFVEVASAAPDRATFLQNPEAGRRLAADARPLAPGAYDLALVVADGLSATAVHAHAAAVVKAVRARLADWRIAPLVVARQARVALGDAIGEALGARAVAVLIGERPGLSAADGLSAYLTLDPHPGRRDSERNCVSNIRTPHGLAPQDAAEAIVWLLREASRMNVSGVLLKDRRAIDSIALSAPPSS